jgi:hypothetical protein
VTITSSSAASEKATDDADNRLAVMAAASGVFILCIFMVTPLMNIIIEIFFNDC